MAIHTDTSIEAIGRFVRERRRANRLSQEALCELAGVGVRFLSELERGKSTLRVHEVNRVLAVFGKQLGIATKMNGADDEPA